MPLHETVKICEDVEIDVEKRHFLAMTTVLFSGYEEESKGYSKGGKRPKQWKD